MVLPWILIALGSYLLGSLPTGFLAGRCCGVDLRTKGSGNIGATNAVRVLGKPLEFTLLPHLERSPRSLRCWDIAFRSG